MGHSTFPQASYQQAAAGVRLEITRARRRLKSLPNPHRRHCLVSFHRARRHEISTARHYTVDIQPALRELRSGKSGAIAGGGYCYPTGKPHLQDVARPKARLEACRFTVTSKEKQSPSKLPHVIFDPRQRQGNFERLALSSCRINANLNSTIYLWISRAEHGTTLTGLLYDPASVLVSSSKPSNRRWLQAACKPGSVPGPKAWGWPFLWDPRRRGPRATDPGDRPGNGPAPDPLAGVGAVAPTWSCSRWGLPCRRRCRRRGALLPHPFTLTRRPTEAGPGGRSALCGTFPGVAPAGRYPAPCFRGARTFLPRLAAGAAIRPPAAAV